ncbi:Cnrip1 [Phodopus roborovskii]|uniref:CB1 cannabinoid receptor-interacting protein 1 n=1 Tax=Phodopus roborovskii TaxID=109678 RepID=A0AAU9ZZM7_PHORO|nr:Cnrip1 [Phodopus roborovskii]
MGDLPGLVRLSIALRIQPNDGPVFFKVDGQRFGQNRTIKLLTGSSYKVEVKIKPTTLQFTDIGTFETVWQVKFYNYHKRDHCQWGSPFSVIEYECKPNETRSLMWVNKESFL